MKSKRIATSATVSAILVISAAMYSPWFRKNNPAVVTPGPVTIPIKPAQEESVASALPVVPNADVRRFGPSPLEFLEGTSFQAAEFLVALARVKNLVLSEGEKERMTLAYLEVCDKRSSYEASIATKTEISVSENLIIIPAYAREGEKLEAELHQRLGEIIGADRMVALQESLDGELYARNYGWGEAEQEIKVKVFELRPNHYVFSLSVGPIHPMMSGARATVSYKNASAILPIDGLDRYSGMVSLLPKRGS